MTNTNVAVRPQLNMGSLSDPAELGRMLAASKYFDDARDAAQAAVKVLAGAELGIPPIAAMTGIYIVKGKVTLSAAMMGALVKASPKYDYKIRERTVKRAVIAFFENGQEQGTSEFTTEMAKTAGLAGGTTWRQYPENMLFWRAMSNGVKMFCPDVFLAPVYTPDELGAEIDPETGDFVALTQVDGYEAPAPAPPAPAPETVETTPETLSIADFKVAEDADAPMTNAEFAKLLEYLDKLQATESFRAMVALAADVEDLAQLTKGQARDVMAQAKKRFGS
jgi:hypothetical protein